MVEISGPEKKIEAFIDLVRPFGILELVRTGRIAMVRNGNPNGGQRSGPQMRDSSIRKFDQSDTKADG